MPTSVLALITSDAGITVICRPRTGLPTGVGEAEQGGAPVGRVRSTADLTLLFERVDQRGDVARGAAQQLREVALDQRSAVVMDHQ